MLMECVRLLTHWRPTPHWLCWMFHVRLLLSLRRSASYNIACIHFRDLFRCRWNTCACWRTKDQHGLVEAVYVWQVKLVIYWSDELHASHTGTTIVGCDIDKVQVQVLAEALKTNTALTSLNLRCEAVLSLFVISNAELTNNAVNRIGDAGACALAEALKQNATVTSLDLSCKIWLFYMALLLMTFCNLLCYYDDKSWFQSLTNNFTFPRQRHWICWRACPGWSFHLSAKDHEEAFIEAFVWIAFSITPGSCCLQSTALAWTWLPALSWYNLSLCVQNCRRETFDVMIPTILLHT